MPGTSADWMQLGLEIVAANQPCKPNHLVKALKQRGASVRAANETLFALMSNGYVRRTWNGKLVVP